MLAGGGVAAAFCSLAFAGYMVSDKTRMPHFGGEEYLTLFASPRGGAQVARAAPPIAAVRDEARRADPAVDPTPTGSIEAAPIARVGGASPNPHYTLVAASPSLAWLESEDGYRPVRPGDVVPGLGRVAAIEQRASRWVLLTDSGVQLQWIDAPAEAAAAAGSRFSRPLIFDSDKK